MSTIRIIVISIVDGMRVGCVTERFVLAVGQDDVDRALDLDTLLKSILWIKDVSCDRFLVLCGDLHIKTGSVCLVSHHSPFVWLF